MEAFFQYTFIQRALLAGIFISIACAILGVFLVLRKDAMLGHGLAHVTFAGVALALLVQIMPLLLAAAVALLTSLLIVKLKEKVGLYGDTAIGIFSSLGMALAIILATLAQRFNVDLFAYLFGDILAIEPFEVFLSSGISLLVITMILIHYHQFLFLTFDRESAQASGIKVHRLDVLLSLLTALTIVLGMKVVGILLVTALLIIPSATGLLLARNFKRAFFFSSGVAVISVVFGLLFSIYSDLPASGSIVIISFILFVVSVFLKKKSF